MQSGDLSTSSATGRHSGILLQLSLPTEDFLSTSFHFPCSLENFRQVPSTFHVAGRPSIILLQLSVQPGHLPSTFCAGGRPSIKFCQLFATGTSSVHFHQLFLWPESWSENFVQAGDLPSTSVNFGCSRETLHKFCQHSVQTEELLSTFCVARRPFVNFCQLSCAQETYRKLPATFCVAGRPSVKFRQFSMWQGDILSTCVNFACGRETIC